MNRSGAPRVTVVSPHFDDAPLSLGQSLLDGALAGCRVRVRVVFGRTNFTRWVHPTRGRAVPISAWRRAEEAGAQVSFGYRVATSPYEEVVLRTGELDPAVLLDATSQLDPSLVDALTDRARRWRGDGSTVLFPAGIGAHLDHRLLAEAGRRLLAEHPDRIGFYEDRPYASLVGSDVVADTLAALDPALVPVEVSGPVTDRLHARLRRCYPSQIDELFVRAMDADRAGGSRERVWFAPDEAPPWLSFRDGR